MSRVPNSDGEKPCFASYLHAATSFAFAELSDIARAIGVASVAPATVSMVHSAAHQLAASRYLHDLAARNDDPKLFAQSANAADQARQLLLSAFTVAHTRQTTHNERVPVTSALRWSIERVVQCSLRTLGATSR